MEKNFLGKEKKENECKKCGGLISIHNKKCYHCDEIRLIGTLVLCSLRVTTIP